MNKNNVFNNLYNINESFWIEASAGSGKTYSIVMRILSMLYNGISGDSVLCITFTNVAAATMQDRIFDNLAMVNNNSEYRQKIASILGINISSDLAKNVLQNYYTVKPHISTIHSFCKSILDVSIKKIIIHSDESDKYMTEIFYKLIKNNQSIQNDIIAIQNIIDVNKIYSLNYSKQLSVEDIQSAFTLNNIHTSEDDLKIYMRNMQDLLSNPMRNIVDTYINQEISFDELVKTCLTQTQSIRQVFCKNKQDYELCKMIFSILDTNDLENIVDINCKVYQIWQIIRSAYQTFKDEMNLYDFDDLIEQGSRLVKDYQHKYCHLFIDESQDTSQKQWVFLEFLIHNIFNRRGTVTIVGDPKQMIYSFHGADIETYFRIKNILIVKYNINILHINESYRSTENVLSYINNVFFKNNKTNVTFYKHISKIHNQNYEAINVINTQDDSVETVAHEIVNYIIQCNKTLWLHTVNRYIEYKDMMILMQRRNPLFFHIHKLLNNNNIPTFMPGKNDITNSVVYNDLLSLGEFICDHTDDFKLAVLLRTSAFNISNDDLHNLAFNRESNLFDRLHQYMPDIAQDIQTIFEYSQSSDPYQTYCYFLYSMNYRCKYTNNIIVDRFLEYAADYDNFYNLIYNPKQKIYVERKNTDGLYLSTVHSAKGLEAHLVILGDPSMQSIFSDYLYNDILIAPGLRKGHVRALYEKAKNNDTAEYHRLLYVALTRSKDYITIVKTNKKVAGWFTVL